MIAAKAVNATLETAYGNANRTIFEAQAIQSTIKEVITRQSDAFGYMKTNLTFSNSEILGYLKNNLIKDYPEGKLMLSLNMTGSSDNQAAPEKPAEVAPAQPAKSLAQKSSGTAKASGSSKASGSVSPGKK